MNRTASSAAPAARRKFADLRICADGSPRARQPFREWSELWIFTGSLCNLSCTGCYTDSNPHNDSFRFITPDQAERLFAQAVRHRVPRLCFTGGEPYHNPSFPAILDRAVALGFDCLVLTNLTRPYEIRGRVPLLAALGAGAAIAIRASLDHPDREIHEGRDLPPRTVRSHPVPAAAGIDRRYWFEIGFGRGAGSFDRTLAHLGELVAAGARVSIAGRAPAGIGGAAFHVYRAEIEPRFRALFRRRGLPDDLSLKIFPDIGAGSDRSVPEITEDRCRTRIPTAVFDGLMCNRIRMAAVPAMLNGVPNHEPLLFPCTIVPDNPRMALGRDLDAATGRPAWLADPRCYRFCIAGGATCSEDGAVPTIA